MKKILFGIGVLIVIFAGIVWLGFFPVARASGVFVWYRDLATFENASAHFRDVAKERDPAFGNSDGNTSDRRRGYLQELIIRTIVDGGLAELDAGSFQGEVDEAVRKAKEGKDAAKLEEATSKLYGIGFSRFQALVLEPQARELVLRKHIESSGKIYADWLGERAKNTAVTIYFLPFVWRDGTVVNK